MNKDEIKKALLYCQEYDCDSCIDCPYYARSEECTNDILKDSLNLITEQEKEIERLKASGYRSIMNAFENNRDKIVENIQTEIDDYKQSIKQAKIDVLNKIKNCREATDSDCYLYLERIVNKVIDEVQK